MTRWQVSVDKKLCISSGMCVAIASDRFASLLPLPRLIWLYSSKGCSEPLFAFWPRVSEWQCLLCDSNPNFKV